MASSSGEVAFLRGLVTSEHSCSIVAPQEQPYAWQCVERRVNARAEIARAEAEKVQGTIKGGSEIRVSRCNGGKLESASAKAIQFASARASAKKTSLAKVQGKTRVVAIRDGIIKRVK